MQKGFVIAIDGPVAAGKSTMARELTRELNGFYLWTGAMYRCVALYCMDHGVAVTNAKEVSAVMPNIHISLNQGEVMLNGRDVTVKIKEEMYAIPTSIVSAVPQVRAIMVKQQKVIASEKTSNGHIVISEGRDLGTVVFPSAALKIFLTASAEVRAQRRLAQMQQQGEQVTFEQILEEIKSRDRRDMTRKASPLATEPEKYGYFVVNDTHLSKEKTIEIITNELKRRKLYDTH